MRTFHRLDVGIWLGLAAWGVGALAAPPKATPAAVRVRPDLVVVSVTAERTGITADGAHRVRLTAVVRCAATVPLSCGTFKILAEYRDRRTGAFTRLGEAGVTGLDSGAATKVVPTAKRTFDDTVPAGRTRNYRVTIDPADAVAEANERNNRASAVYRATGCPGTDLVLTQVSMRRAANGGTFIQVWVRNRCLLPCVAELVYSIGESEAVPGAAGVEQTIGSRIEGDTEVGPLGTVVAAGLADRDATYTVSVEARGGSCPESSTANNSCRVTIPAGVTSRTVRCGAL